MKKLFFAILALVSIVFADVNFDNPNVVDEIGIGGTYPNFKLLDPHAAGLWFLRAEYPAKWDRVKDDEFEQHDAIQSAFKTLKSLAKPKYDEYINQKSSILTGIRFGRYDFKSHSFPLDVIGKNSFFKFDGKRLISTLKVYFDNTGDEEKKLYMPVKEAKTFVEQRKNSDGWVDRELDAKYYFRIKKIKTNINKINENEYTPDTWGQGYEPSDVTVIGHIYKIEIIDPKTNKVIATFNKK